MSNVRGVCQHHETPHIGKGNYEIHARGVLKSRTFHKSTGSEVPDVTSNVLSPKVTLTISEDDEGVGDDAAELAFRGKFRQLIKTAASPALSNATP